jgi:sugar O-acyltransferase (sialic acid O-acetyltransferase NeuD family)
VENRSAVIWGGTGHAKVVYQLLKSSGIAIACICDRNPEIVSPIPGIPILHGENDFLTWLQTADRDNLTFVAAIGGAGGASRLAVHAYMTHLGIAPISLTHPTAWVDATATFNSGDQVLAMAAVGVEVSFGKQCIVNTNATIDHDTHVGDGVHVMPGATIAGQVVIGNEAVIGSNATVLPNLRVGDQAVVGAGAVVTHDVAPGSTVVGVPARMVGLRDLSREVSEDPWRYFAGGSDDQS